MKGTLYVLGYSEVPAFNRLDEFDAKLATIRKWLEWNFDRESHSEAEFYEKFEDYENENELQLEIELQSKTTADLIKEAWGLFVTVDEFERLVKKIDEDDDDDWLPSLDRVEIEEDSEDEFYSLEDLQAQSKFLRSHLEEIQGVLPPQIGHNNPPSGIVVNREQIDRLFERMKAFEEIEDGDVDAYSADISKLSEEAQTLGHALKNFLVKQTGNFISKAVEEAGTQTGKWGGRALVFLLAGDGLINFASRLIAFLGSQ